MTLKVRYPDIDYSKIKAHWARNLAFSHDRNASSFIPQPVEPWLIRLLQSAIEKIPADDPKLREDVLGFIRQESQHYKQHRLFNDRLIEQGYPKLRELEQELAADLERFLKDRSLKFCLAYADGFESLGAISGQVWFENSDEMLEGADPNAEALWKWHMAEEFEHREVCYDIYHALFGRGIWNGIVNGYFYRLYGFIFAMVHLRGFAAKLYNYMIEIDKETMSEADKEKFEQDEKDFKAFQKKHFFAPLLKNFLPWYDPGNKRTPRGLFEYLRQFEAGGKYAKAGARG